MEEEHDCYPIPPEDLRCSYRYEAFVRCKNWRIQDQGFCQVHFLEYRDAGTMMVEKEKGTKSSVRVSKDEIEKTASSAAAAATKGKGRGRKEKGKTVSRRKRGRNEDDEEEKEVIPERKVRRKLEVTVTEEMKMEEEEEVDLEDSVAEEAPKRRGRKPAK